MQAAHRDSSMSFDSSSNSSKSSKSAKLDDYQLRIGTDPMKRLFASSAPTYYIPYFLGQLCKIIELMVCAHRAGLEVAIPLAFWTPVCELLSQQVTRAFAQSAAGYITKQLSKNYLVAANIYFAHFFVLALAWAILSLIFYQTLLLKVNYSQILGDYIIYRGSVSVFTSVFSSSMIPFLQAESRHFLILMKEVVESALFIVLLIAQYNEQAGDSQTLSAAGKAYCVSNAFATIWMMFVVFKLPFFDVEYKAVLKFRTKRLSPLRAKILVQIVVNAISPFFINASDSLLALIAMCLVTFKCNDERFKLVQSMRIICFIRVRNLLQTFYLTFRDVFYAVSQYNVTIKKITRVYEALMAYQLFYFPIGFSCNLILLLTARYLPSFLFGVDAATSDDFTSFALQYCVSSAQAGAWCMFLPSMYYAGIAVLVVEGRHLYCFLVSLLVIASGMVLVGLAYAFYGDNAPYTLAIALNEAMNASLGFGLIAWYVIKYGNIYRANKKAAPIDTEKIDTQNIDVRESLMQQLERPDKEVEEEMMELERRKDKNLAVFNKSLALRSSRQFASLRESLGGDRASLSRDNGSIIRASQINATAEFGRLD